MAAETKPRTPTETLATPRAAADLLGLPVATVLRLAIAGRVKTERIKQQMYICLEDVEREALR